MRAQVVNSAPKEIDISVTGTDIGILYIIQHEILKASNTNFAGVIVKHPLTNECWIRVNSSTKPLNEIKKATETAIRTANDLKTLIDSAIKVN